MVLQVILRVLRCSEGGILVVRWSGGVLVVRLEWWVLVVRE